MRASRTIRSCNQRVKGSEAVNSLQRDGECPHTPSICEVWSLEEWSNQRENFFWVEATSLTRHHNRTVYGEASRKNLIRPTNEGWRSTQFECIVLFLRDIDLVVSIQVRVEIWTISTIPKKSQPSAEGQFFIVCVQRRQVWSLFSTATIATPTNWWRRARHVWEEDWNEDLTANKPHPSSRGAHILCPFSNT